MEHKYLPPTHEDSRWKKLIEHLPVMIFESNLSNEITYASENVFETLGYSHDELVGKKGVDLFHPADRERLLQNIWMKLEGKIPENTKYSIRKKNGEYIVATFRSVPVIKEGKTVGIIGAAFDISDTEKLDKELSDSEIRYRSLFENATLGIYRSTPDGKIIVANTALIRIFGYDSLEDLKKASLEKQNELTGFGQKSFKKRLEKEGKIIGLETVWTRKDGTKIWLRESATLIKDEEGNPLYYDVVIEDITFRKNTEALIRKQQNLLNISQQMANMGSWEEDLITGTTLWSREEYDLFELPEGTPANETLLFSKVHPEDSHLLQNRMEILKSKAGKMEVEYRLLLKDKVKWIRSVMSSHADEKGKVVQLYGIDMDITTKKKQQLQLERESCMLKKSQELGRIGTWELNLKTKNVKASEILIDLLGLPRKEHYSLTDFTQRIHPDDIKEHGLAKEDWNLLKKDAFNSTYRLLINGKVIWVNTVGEVVEDKSGEPQSVIIAVQDITWQKDKELLLDQLEQERAAILRAIPDMIFVFDREGVYRDFKPSTGVQPTLPPEQFPGKKITEAFPDEIAQKHLSLLQKAFATGQAQTFNYNLKLNGKIKYFEARISPVNHDRAVVIVRDVTRRESAQKSLQKSNENLKLYSRALEESPVSVIITDAHGNIEYVNKSFTKNTGYLPEEVLGKNSRVLKSGLQDRDFYHRLWRTLLSGKIWQGVYANRKKDGGICWESATISPIYNQKQEISHFIQVSEDITEKKKVMESVQKMAAIVDSSDAIIIGKTLSGLISSWNRGAEKTYGYKAEEVIGLPINIIVPTDLKKELTRFTSRIKAGERVEHFETRRICKDGTEVEVSLSLSGIKNEKGELTGIAVVGQDISRQKQLERELVAEKEKAEEATRTKSLFLANMSHEIRTPLNAILGFSEILSKRLKDPVQKEYAASMHNSGKALLHLINDLLDLSKAEAGKLEFHRQSIDVRYLVHDIESIFRLKAQQKQLEFRMNIAKNVPRSLLLDELKIRQILLNLTSNAVKFTEKGFVEISIKAEHVNKDTADLILEVRDSGKGIPAKYHKKIFKLFEQQNTAISKQYGGTGLGLAITQQIVTQMQGRIDLESEEGKGSLFRVYLPAISLTEVPPIKKAPKEMITPQGVLFEPATILIVDDTFNNRFVLKATFEEYPFRTLEAENGMQAIEHLENNKVDLVFMDIRMPVMDGLEAVEKIRARQEWSHIPIVALTASTTEFEENKFLQKGFNTYLRKPATLVEIITVLTQYLKHESVRKPKDAEFVEVSPGTIEHFSEILHIIESKIIPFQQKLTGIRPREEVNKLAGRLINLGKQYKAEEILLYGENLLLASKNFLLEKEKYLIDNLPKFVEHIKKSYNESKNK